MSKAKPVALMKVETSDAVQTRPEPDAVLVVEPRRTLIQATEADPEPAPPAGGSWLRLEDGSLQPRDEATARDAGLAWPV